MNIRKQYEQYVDELEDSSAHKEMLLTNDLCYLEWLAEQGKKTHYTREVGKDLQAYVSYDGEHFHFMWQNSRHNLVIENLISWYEEAQ